MQLTEFSLSNNNILPSFVVPTLLEEKHCLKKVASKFCLSRKKSIVCSRVLQADKINIIEPLSSVNFNYCLLSFF